jgi:hypothetical protein
MKAERPRRSKKKSKLLSFAFLPTLNAMQLHGDYGTRPHPKKGKKSIVSFSLNGACLVGIIEQLFY